MESPVIQKRIGLSPIWILPLVALCIGGWLLYTSYRDAGIDITIHFNNAEGITSGKTQVMYKGVAVGQVEEIQVDDDLQGVELKVKLVKKARRGVVEDTKFWVVRPEISAGKVSGLETLLSGSYIAVQPGVSKDFATYFEGLNEEPPVPPDSPGLHITLVSNALYSLQKDSPVYNRNLKIGKVLRYYLAEDKSILIDLYIEPEYSHLIQMGTRFWNSSGISVDGNLQSGFSLKFQSMAALIYGGISCSTPEPLAETSPRAVNGLVYKLYPSYEAAEYWLPMTLQLESAEGIIEGKTKVMFRGLKAGVVRNIQLNNDEKKTVTAEILLDPRAEPILKKGTRFWVVRPEISLNGISQFDSLLSGPYISFMPGEGVFQDKFVAIEGKIPRPPKRPGKHFTLTSGDSGSLESGAPLMFKKMVVGEVRNVGFAPDGESVDIDILIYNDFSHLIRKDSVFWNVSGIELDASFSHVNVNLSSLKTVLTGGIAFANPGIDRADDSLSATEGDSFTMYDSYSQAMKMVPALRPQGMVLKLESTGDMFFDIGSPILYKRITIGEVLDFFLTDENKKIVFEVLIEEKYTDLITTKSLFYNYTGLKIKADLSGVDIEAGPVTSILTGGISVIASDRGKPIQEGDIFKLYADYDAAVNSDSVPITIVLTSAGGVKERTRITFQGIQVGSVKNVRFAPDMKTIIADAWITKEAGHLLRETTRLWLVKPDIGLSGVRHLDTLLKGSYIEIIPGEGGAPRSEFVLLDKQPHPDSHAGFNVILETPRLGSLDIDSPVYYRQIRVGRVTGFELSPTADQVWIRVNIESPFTKLVQSGTRFWQVSGVRISGGLFSGFDITSESLEAVLAGGIAFATPEDGEAGKPVMNNDHFTLHEKSEKTWLDWKPKIMLNEETDKSEDSDLSATDVLNNQNTN